MTIHIREQTAIHSPQRSDQTQRHSILHFHHTPGRLRVRLSNLVRNGAAAAPLARELLAVRGVKSALVNPSTGSLLVLYERDYFDLEVFWIALQRRGYVDSSAIRALCNAAGGTDSLARLDFTKALVRALAGVAVDHCLGPVAGTLVGLLLA